MEPDDVPTELDERLLRGLDLFDAGEHYEAHEVLEDLWSGEVGATRHLLQALIQTTVALHHRGNGNLGGARVLLERALDHLAEVKEPACFLEPRRFESAVAALHRELVAAAGAAGVAPGAAPWQAEIPRFDDARAQIRARRRARGLPEI